MRVAGMANRFVAINGDFVSLAQKMVFGHSEFKEGIADVFQLTTGSVRHYCFKFACSLRHRCRHNAAAVKRKRRPDSSM
jgi:hypothetical protein